MGARHNLCEIHIVNWISSKKNCIIHLVDYCRARRFLIQLSKFMARKFCRGQVNFKI